MQQTELILKGTPFHLTITALIQPRVQTLNSLSCIISYKHTKTSQVARMA